MLENVWVIPAITFASFWLILFFGKRLPFKGSEVGLFAVGLCLVLSTVAGFQWINHHSEPVKAEAGASAAALQALFGWELMGVCSFMLIGHWWEESKNSDAALKAFFTTRTGDIGLLVGISILFWEAGRTFDIATINAKALNGQIGHTVLVWAA